MTTILSNHLKADSAYEALRRDVLLGLRKTPKVLPSKWFYDSVGGELFDRITRLPEYYPARAEAQILSARSAEVASASAANSLVELGSGTSTKSRMLLDALRETGALRQYVPFDVDARTLKTSAAAIGIQYPDLEIHAICGDFEEHLGQIPADGRRLFAFLGSTIGNFTAGPRAEFLTTLATAMRTGDSLLLGTDLVKDPDRLVRAYDDAAGITARFNRNVLAVINRELDADFDLDAYTHVARWNAAAERIEMWLRTVDPQRVHVGALDLTVEFAAGEQMLTEVSCKFRPDGVAAELAAAGLRRTRWWTDDDGDFGVALAVKYPASDPAPEPIPAPVRHTRVAPDAHRSSTESAPHLNPLKWQVGTSATPPSKGVPPGVSRALWTNSHPQKGCNAPPAGRHSSSVTGRRTVGPRTAEESTMTADNDAAAAPPLDVTITRSGGAIARYGLALVIGWIGVLKFTAYEAQGIQPLVANSPLMSWLYHFFSVTTFSSLLGVVEVTAAVLLAVKPWLPKVSALGSVVSVGLFAATISFLFTTPGATEATQGGFPWLSMTGQFLLKDVVLLGIAVWTLGDALGSAKGHDRV